MSFHFLAGCTNIDSYKCDSNETILISNASGNRGKSVCPPISCDPEKKWMRYCLDCANGRFNFHFRYSSNESNTNFYTISAGECTNFNKPSWEWRKNNSSITIIASGVNYDGYIKGRFQCSK